MPEPLRNTPPEKNYSDPEEYYGKCGPLPPERPGAELALSVGTRDKLRQAAQSPGVSALVDKFKAHPPLAAAATPKPTDTNSERVSAMNVEAFHAEFGQTSSKDSLYASAALLKGTLNGAEVELFGVSRQVGLETEDSFVLGHAGIPLSSRSSAFVEACSARVNAGIHDNDGSEGLNAGVQLTAAQVEVAHQFQDREARIFRSGDSVAFGLSAGAGFEISTGDRDLDGDGKIEKCLRVLSGVAVLGLCLEEP
jgi:hypothetical protein